MPLFVQQRRFHFERLYKALETASDSFILPEAAPMSTPSWFGFLLTCKKGVCRDSIIQYIESKGIQTRMLFAGNLIKHPCFEQMRSSKKGFRIIGDLKNTNRIMRDTFWIGVYPGMTEEMIDYMAKTILETV